jgi:hypothetical protein
MKSRLPFIASIISGVIIWILTALFIREYLALTTIILLIAIVLMRGNSWALIGGFLTSLAIQLFNSGKNDQLLIVVVILIFGIALQLAVSCFSPLLRGSPLPSSSIGQNMVFGIIGISLCVGFRLLLCKPSISFESQSLSGQIFEGLLQLQRCDMKLISGTLPSNISQELGAFCNDIFLVCLKTLALSYLVWAAFFSALRQTNFNILSIRRLLSQTIKSFSGSLIIMFLFYIIVVIFFIPILLFVIFFFHQSAIIEQFALISYLLYYLLFIICIAFGAGWGSRWGNT